MKLLSFQSGTEVHVGAALADGIVDLTRALHTTHPDIRFADSLLAIIQAGIDIDSVGGVSVANSDSRGGRGLKEAIAVLSPAIRVKLCERGRGCATPLRRSHSRQSGMTAKLVVKHLVVLELPFEIALVPEPDPIQILTPDGVSTENSNSNILMMEPAQNRNRHDIADRLLTSEQWCVFAQR